MNHLYEQLTALKLTGFRDALKKQLAQPGTYQELGFEERLSLLTAEELTCRENRKAERLIKHARFRLNAELSKLDYRNNRGLDRALIRSLSQGNWLTLKQNILLTGATGSGKTFLACALGHNACRQGYKVYYYRLKALMEQCYQGHADGRYSKLLTRLNNSDLLLLDDWGLEPLSSEQRSDLLEIVDLMYQRGSIIVVSQLPVENWYKMIGDSTHADAILDRLVHGSIKIGFAPIFPDTCYHLTHYWLAAVDIPVASDNPVHYADAIRYNARTPLQGSLLPLTRLVWA